MRSRRRALLAAAVAAALAACGVLSVEEQILKEFFNAAGLRDTTRMARVSAPTVDFNPRIHGVVDRFEVSESRPTGEGDARVLMVDARVRLPDGRTAIRKMTIGLRRGPDRRWRVTKIEG